MPTDPTLSAVMEYVKLFGSFAFGLAVLVMFIKHLKDLRASDKADWAVDKKDFQETIKSKDVVIAQLQATIVGLQNDYIKTSQERSKLYAEAQLLVSKAMESQDGSFKEMVRKMDDLLRELARGRTGIASP